MTHVISAALAHAVADALLSAALPTTDITAQKGITRVVSQSAKRIRESLQRIGIDTTVTPYLWQGRLAFTIVPTHALGAYEHQVILAIHGLRTKKCDVDRRIESNMLAALILSIKPHPHP